MRCPVRLLSFLSLLLSYQAGRADILVWDAASGTAGAQDGAGTWTLGAPNWFNQTTTTDDVNWVDGSDAIFGAGNGAAGAVTLGGPITLGTLIFNAAGSGTYAISGDTLTLGDGVITANASASISSILAGTAGLAKSGDGVLTLSGSSANTYSGTTSISGGTLLLGKDANVTAIQGDISISNGGRLRMTADEQIADTATVTMSGSGSVFNGTAISSGQGNKTETFANLLVTGGVVNAGANATGFVITGTASFTGGAGNTIYVGNSGSTFSASTLILTGMTSTTGLSSNSFTIFGNSTSLQSSFTVGAGGLELNGSILNMRQGTTSSGAKGSRLVLDGNVKTSGSSASQIRYDAAGGLDGEVAVYLSSTAGDVTRTFDIAGGGADLEISVGIKNGAATSAGIIKDGAGTLTFSVANSFTGDTAVNAGTLLLGHQNALAGSTFAGGAGTLNFGSLTAATFGGLSGSSDLGLVNDSSAAVALSIGGNNATNTYTGALSGTGSLTKSGTGTFTLGGTTANTYSGLTSVTAGRLILSKTAGTDAVAGDLSISGGADVTFGASNQIADTATVTMSGAGSTFNGTGPNAGTLAGINETFAVLTISGGTFNTSSNGRWTIGAVSFIAGENKLFVGNSGSRQTFGSLSLEGMNGTSSSNSVTNGFTLFGNGNGLANRTTLTIGAGGLSLDDSRIYMGNGTSGSELVLNGDVTTLGAVASSIEQLASSGFLPYVSLSGVSGTVSRTFNIGGGGADLTIVPVIQNGAATAAGLIKDGAGTLTLSGSNTYTGGTTLLSGTLQAASTGALGTGDITFTGGTLQYTAASSSTDWATRFKNSTAAISLDTNGEDVALAGIINSSNTGGLAKIGSGTLTLSGSNTFTGESTVVGGTLLLGHQNALAASTFAGGAGMLSFGSLAAATFGGLSGTSDLALANDTSAAVALTVGNNDSDTSYAGVLSGAGSLTKSGAGVLSLSGANTYTGVTTVLEGTLNIASGGSIGVAAATADSLQVAERSTASFTVQAGGSLQVGSGSTSFLYVGSRGNVSGSAATIGTLDLSASTSFTANVGRFFVGVGETSNAGITRGIVDLAANNTITASESIIVADMVPALDNSNATAGVSQLNFGSGSNNITTPLLIIGGSRSRGTSTIGAGGTLTLNNGAGTTTLYIGRNNVETTSTTSEGSLDLTGGTFIANLGEVIIGARVSGVQSNTGRGVGTLTLGSSALNNVTADSLTLGSLGASASSSNVTEGTLNMAGGIFSVTNDVSLADHTANGGFSRGTLNLTGGSFNIGGNITKADKTQSTAVVIVDGAALTVTGGAIASSQFAYRSGSISSVTSVTLDANSATTGTGDTGDALILGDVTVGFDVTLSGSSGGNVHYEAGTAAGGSTVSGNIALGTVTRTFNIENNVNAIVDTNVMGVLSGDGGITKTGAGTLQLGSANTHNGDTTVSGGLVIVNHGQALQNSTVMLEIANGLQFASGITSFTLGGLAGGSAATLTLDDASAQAVNLTVGGNGVSSTYSGTLAGGGRLIKTGAGTLTLDGSAAGTFTGLANAGIDLSAGGISFQNNVGLGVDLGSGSLHLADQTSLSFDIGSSSNFDFLKTTAVAMVDSNATIQLHISALSDIISASQSYDLITGGAGSGFDAAGLTWQLNVSGGSFKYQLVTTDTLVQFQTLSAITGDAYWHGDYDGSWSSVILGASNNTNWATDDTGTTDREAGPGSATTVYFSNANAVGPVIDTMLDNDFTINNLVFLGSPAGVTNVTIAQGVAGTLTLAPASVADGIRVDDNAGAIAISAPVELGAAQTWEVSDLGASLVVSGQLLGGDGASLTKTGAGTLTLSGTNSYTGQTIVQEGTLAINSEVRLGDNPATFVAGQLTLDGGALQTTSSMTINDSNRGVLLGAGGGTFNVNSSTTLTMSTTVTGSGDLTKRGNGTLTLAGANTYTGDTTVFTGTLRIAAGASVGVAGATAGSLQIGETSTGTVVVEAGGELRVGSGSSNSLLVGARTTLSGTTTGTLNMSAATSFTANVGLFQIGGSTSTSQASASGSAAGTATLAQNNTITASTGIVIAEMAPAVGNTGVVSTLTFGAGNNDVITPYLLVGGSRSKGRLVITAGGTLTLNNGAGKTDLTIGSNHVQGTNTFSEGEMDLTGGVLIATLGQVIIGDKSSSTNTGAGTGAGILTLDATANSVTADSVVLGNLAASATSANITQGTLNFGGGTFTVANDVGLGIISNGAGAVAQGTLNLTDGTFTVGGNITSTNSAKSAAVVMLDGATLDMTGGSIDANTFDVRSGALKDVSEIYNGGGTVAADLTKTTTGTLSLIGTNNYSGATVVTDGALEVRGTTGTGAVSAQTGSTIFGTGVVQGTTFTLDDGATLRPGGDVGDGSHGTLAFTPATASGSTSSLQGTVILGISGATLTDASYGGNLLGSAGYNAWADGVSGVGSHDRLVFNDPVAGSGYSLSFLTTTGSLQIVADSFVPQQGMAFNLLDWGGLVTPDFTGFTFNSGYLVGNGDEGADLDLPDLSAAGLAWDFSRFTTSGVVVIVPEPSRALLLLLGIMGVLLRRRRMA
ncbi:MAG: autotransporter-associated beta strand repeat-containing protein [Prosthecobacter sp.]